MSAIGGGLVAQPAAATHNCGDLEQLAYFSTGAVGWLYDQEVNDGKCTDNHASTSYAELDGNETKLDIYNALTGQQAQSESFDAVYDNYLQDTEPSAWMAAEIAVAEAYENGSSESVAKNQARAAIGDYYAVKEINLIESWNNTVASWMAMKETAQNQSGISGNYVTLHDGGGPWYSGSDSHSIEVITQTVTLSNGSTHDVKVIRAHVTYNSNYATTFHLSPHDGSEKVGGDTWAGQPIAFRVQPPDSNYDPLIWRNADTVASRYDSIGTQNDNLQAEVDPFVTNTWDAYDSGQINSSDVLSANTQMFRYGAEASNGSDLYTSVAALSAMGLDTPTLNGTGTMSVTYQNVEYHGLIMAREAPNGTWEANTTYNTSNINGSVFLVTTDGQKIDLEGEFRISAISSTDGSNIQNVTATKVVYKTSNTSELLNKMDRIVDLRKEVEAKQQAAAGDGSGSPIDPKYLLGGLAVIGLLAYAKGKENKGS